jgi:hypothetical protein
VVTGDGPEARFALERRHLAFGEARKTTPPDFSPENGTPGQAFARIRNVSWAATIYCLHLEPMAAFYQVCFGFEVIDNSSEGYRILESETWTLSVVQVSEPIAATITLSRPPMRRENTPDQTGVRSFQYRGSDPIQSAQTPQSRNDWYWLCSPATPLVRSRPVPRVRLLGVKPHR